MSKLMLYLKVINNEALESGRKSNTIFDQAGGTIGSHPNNFWSIQNQLADIANVQARIEWRENHYCITAVAPKVYVNQSDIFAQRQMVQLQQGDKLQIGNLHLFVAISDDIDNADPLATPLSAIVSTYNDHLQEILDKKESKYLNGQDLDERHDQTLIERETIDPIAILNTDAEIHTKSANHTLLDTDISMLFHSNTQEPSMPTDIAFLDLPKAPLVGEEENLEVTHLTLTPLLRGLGANIPLTNSKEMHDFLEEIGASLRKTIEGILSLNITHAQLAEKHLRPIEDNPLRLQAGFNETVDMMYTEQRSPVHLSPPAAIEESLNNLRLHQQASQAATTRALEALLIAFSPENLTKRFVRYRKTSDASNVDSHWVWNMYQNYYQEMTSNRQHGFEKLFSEVYQQTYDYEIRRLQQDA